MVIPPLIGNPDNGYQEPYCKVDDYPYNRKRMGVLEPSTFDKLNISHTSMVIIGPYNPPILEKHLPCQIHQPPFEQTYIQEEGPRDDRCKWSDMGPLQWPKKTWVFTGIFVHPEINGELWGPYLSEVIRVVITPLISG